MKITYDHNADAMYLEICGGPRHRQKQINLDVTLDIDTNGRVVGVEIMNAVKKYGEQITNISFSNT